MRPTTAADYILERRRARLRTLLGEVVLRQGHPWFIRWRILRVSAEPNCLDLVQIYRVGHDPRRDRNLEWVPRDEIVLLYEAPR